MSTEKNNEDLLSTTESYYDSPDADNFYYQIWGGEDIHVGLYEPADEPIVNASQKTVAKMADMLKTLSKDAKVLDIGAGYGGSARYLAREYGCEVICNNISKAENDRNEQKNKEQGLDHLIKVEYGNFEDLPYEDNTFDIIWMQDAILHSGKKEVVFKEVDRVIKAGGEFIFTDPMQADDCPEGVLDPVLQRIHLDHMGSVKWYREILQKLGFEEVQVLEMPHQLVNHYGNVRKKLIENYDELSKTCSTNYLDKMKDGLWHWVDKGQKGYLNWGIIHFRKK